MTAVGVAESSPPLRCTRYLRTEVRYVILASVVLQEVLEQVQERSLLPVDRFLFVSKKKSSLKL